MRHWDGRLRTQVGRWKYYNRRYLDGTIAKCWFELYHKLWFNSFTKNADKMTSALPPTWEWRSFRLTTFYNRVLPARWVLETLLYVVYSKPDRRFTFCTLFHHILKPPCLKTKNLKTCDICQAALGPQSHVAHVPSREESYVKTVEII